MKPLKIKRNELVDLSCKFYASINNCMGRKNNNERMDNQMCTQLKEVQFKYHKVKWTIIKLASTKMELTYNGFFNKNHSLKHVNWVNKN